MSSVQSTTSTPSSATKQGLTLLPHKPCSTPLHSTSTLLPRHYRTLSFHRYAEAKALLDKLAPNVFTQVRCHAKVNM